MANLHEGDTRSKPDELTTAHNGRHDTDLMAKLQEASVAVCRVEAITLEA